MTTKPDESGAASAAQDEFDTAWDEAEAEDAAAAPAEAADDDDGEDPAPASDDLDPSAAEDADEPPADEADGEPEKQPDIWAGASPELIAARDKLRADYEQRLKSDAGRVAAYQRQAEAARQELAALKAAKPPVPEEDAEALRSAEEEYPEVVKPILSRLERQQAVIDQVVESERSREAQAAAAREAHEAAETEKVNAALPDFLDMISFQVEGTDERSPTPEFLSWYKRQSPEVQAKVNRNADSITDATSAIEVLTAYRDFQARIDAAAAAAAEAQAAPTSTRRQRQIESSRAVSKGTQQTGLTSAVPNDWDGAWEALDRQEAARAR